MVFWAERLTPHHCVMLDMHHTCVRVRMLQRRIRFLHFNSKAKTINFQCSNESIEFQQLAIQCNNFRWIYLPIWDVICIHTMRGSWVWESARLKLVVYTSSEHWMWIPKWICKHISANCLSQNVHGTLMRSYSNW